MKNVSTQPSFLYHITHPEQMAEARRAGRYEAASLVQEGFIHCSFSHQMLKTANRFYHGQRDLIILKLDPGKVKPEVKLEPAENGELFPHIYGSINLDALLAELPFQPDADGEFRTLPQGCV